MRAGVKALPLTEVTVLNACIIFAYIFTSHFISMTSHICHMTSRNSRISFSHFHKKPEYHFKTMSGIPRIVVIFVAWRHKMYSHTRSQMSFKMQYSSFLWKLFSVGGSKVSSSVFKSFSSVMFSWMFPTWDDDRAFGRSGFLLRQTPHISSSLTKVHFLHASFWRKMAASDESLWLPNFR